MRDPYDVVEIFREMEIHLIRSMRRNLARHKAEEKKEGFTWEQWQAVKLRNLGKFRRENKDIISKQGSRARKEIENNLYNAYSNGQSKVNNLISNVWGKVKGLFQGKAKPKVMPVTDDSFFGMNEKKINALVDAITGDFKKAEHAIFRKMNDVYRQTIYKSQVYMDGGAVSLNQAIDMATKDFLEKGINSIVYKDGTKANITSYAEMALRTASQRATFTGEGKKRDEWGIYTIVVSEHATACPLCVPWQGKVLIDDVFSNPPEEYIKENKKYDLLSKAIDEGLLHPNCRHTLTTYFPGITSLPEKLEVKDIEKNYKAEQRQRLIERQIRKFKRLEEGSLDEDNQIKYASEVAKWQSKMREHLEENPQLRRAYQREQAN